jgi:hypothetical protein
MTHKLLRVGWLFLLLGVLCFWPDPVARAQSSAITFKNLLVEIWPEYDRPEVLVIYRGELSPTTPLPAQLVFRLPGYLEAMHAVAVERDGVLVDVDPAVIELRHEGEDLLLTFSPDSAKIQFEYYDPVILTQQNQIRQLAFQFSVPYRIETTTFEVQEPFQAEDFSLTPEPGDAFVGRDGLNYHTIQVAGLAPPDTFELSATYERDTTELSAQQLAGNVSAQPPSISVITEPSTSEGFKLGYLLIGGGVLLLLAVGGYWWWTSNKQAEPEPSRRRATRPKSRRKGRQKESDKTPTVNSGGFCYRCGTALRADANFCHNCGAERRGG